MPPIYYFSEDADLLQRTIGLSDPFVENHPWEGDPPWGDPAQLTEEELHETGNELLIADFFELAQTYTEDNPLSAEHLYQDPLLIRLMGNHRAGKGSHPFVSEEEAGEFSLSFPPKPDFQKFEMMGSITVEPAEIEKGLDEDHLVLLKNSDPFAFGADRFTLAVFKWIYQQETADEAGNSFLIDREGCRKGVEALWPEKSVREKDLLTDQVFNEMQILWGVNIENGPWWLNMFIPNSYGQIDLAPSEIKIQPKILKKYIKKPHDYPFVDIPSYENHYPYQINGFDSREEISFPTLNLNLHRAFLGEGFVSNTLDWLGAGVFLEMNDARMTSLNQVESGELRWGGARPLIKIEGMTLRMKPALIKELPCLGIGLIQNKIVVVFKRDHDVGILGDDFIFWDITPQVYINLCRLDPPDSCVDYHRILEVVFTEEGKVRDNPPLHELGQAILMVLQQPKKRKTEESFFDRLINQIPTNQVSEEVLVKNFYGTFGPKNISSLQNALVTVTSAEIFGTGSAPDRLILQATIPFNLKSSWEVDGGFLPIDVQSEARLSFNTATGQGWITLDTEEFLLDYPLKDKDDSYKARLTVPFFIPYSFSQKLDYKKILEEAFFSLFAHVEKNNRKWLLAHSSGEIFSDLSQGPVQLVGDVDFFMEAKGVATGLLGYQVLLDTQADFPFKGASLAGDADFQSRWAQILGQHVLAGAYFDDQGGFHFIPRAEAVADLQIDQGEANALGRLTDGEIVLTPNPETKTYTLEFKNVAMSVEGENLKPAVEASGLARLDGSWTLQGDSWADLTKPQNWIGSGRITLGTFSDQIDFQESEEEGANQISADIDYAGGTVLQLGNLEFGEKPLLSGQFSSELSGGEIIGEWGGIPFRGVITNARGTIRGTIIPRETALLIQRETVPDILPVPVSETISPVLEEEPLFVEQHVSPFQQESVHQIYRKMTSRIPPEERIKNPKTRREKVNAFFQQVIDALPSLQGFDFTKADVRIAPDADYQDGKAKIPLLGDKQKGIQVTVQQGTKVDPQKSSILAEEGKLKEFKLELNHPITVAGLIKVSGVELASSRCPLTGKVRHDLMVKTCLGNFNILSLLNLIGNQFDACSFYKMLKEKYGIDIPRNSVPRDLNQLGLFLYELFKLYGDRLDSLTRPESGAPDMIAIRELAGNFNLHLKPGLSIDMNDLHAETDQRARGAFDGKFEWKPEANLIDVRMAQKEGEAVEGIVVDMEGDKAMSAVFDRISAIHYRSQGEGLEREYQVSVGDSHVDNLNVVYTPAGETEPLFHLVSGNNPNSGEHSFIEVDGFQVARVKEPDGEFHYEVKVEGAKAHSPNGHVDFSYEGRSGRYDYSGGYIENLDVDLLGKSFPALEENNPVYSGFANIMVDGDLEHPENPNVSDKNPWAVLDLGEGGELVFDRLSTRQGHVHVETKTDATGETRLPIGYSGLVDMLARIPEDPRFKGLEAIAVKGPALVTLDGPEGRIAYFPFDGEEYENLDVTVAGRFDFPLEGGELHVSRVSIPLLELALHQQKTDGSETTALKRLVLADGLAVADLYGVYTTPELWRLGRRQVEIPEGSQLQLKPSQNLVVEMEEEVNILPIDLQMMLSTQEGRRLAQIELIGFLVQAGLVQIKSSRLDLKNIRDHLFGTEISFEGRIEDVSVEPFVPMDKQ